jgi:hypothetical protein
MKGYWMEKLKPSSKNQVIQQKLRKNSNPQCDEQTKDIDKMISEFPNEGSGVYNQTMLSIQWDKYLKMSKSNTEINFNDQSIVKKGSDISMISENFDEINGIIGKFKFLIK